MGVRSRTGNWDLVWPAMFLRNMAAATATERCGSGSLLMRSFCFYRARGVYHLFILFQHNYMYFLFFINIVLLFDLHMYISAGNPQEPKLGLATKAGPGERGKSAGKAG